MKRLLTGKTLTSYRKPKTAKLSKKKSEILETSGVIARNIVHMIKQSGIHVRETQYLSLKDRICANDGIFTIKMLAEIGFTDDFIDGELRFLLLAEEGTENSRTGVGKFNQEMEGFFRRLERGNGLVGLFFISMRASSTRLQHAMHVRLDNHYMLNKLIEDIERLEESENRKIIDGLYYHTKIDGVHLDCVPLYTNNLPVEWVISVKMPDCKCECANWEKKPFMGEGWK